MAVKTKAAADKQIVIPSPKIEVISIPIEGITSLIIHAWSEKAIRQMLSKQMKLPTTGKDAKDPDADFIEARYIVKEGKREWDGILCCAFKQAIVGACRQVDGFHMTTAQRCFFVEADGHCVKPIEFEGRLFNQTHDLIRINGEPRMRMDMARNDNGSADIRFRPEY